MKYSENLKTVIDATKPPHNHIQAVDMYFNIVLESRAFIDEFVK